MAVTLPVTAQSPKETRIVRPRPDHLDELEIVLVGHGAFQQCHVDPLGENLGVDQGAVDDIDHSRQVDQELVEVQERHVASGAAPQPHGCELQMFHCFFSRALIRNASIDRSRSISATVEPWPKMAPVGQACMHLPQDVQVGDVPQG